MKDCSISNALAMEILQSCPKPSIFSIVSPTLRWHMKFCLLLDKNLFIYSSQYHRCWWPSDTRRASAAIALTWFSVTSWLQHIQQVWYITIQPVWPVTNIFSICGGKFCKFQDRWHTSQPFLLKSGLTYQSVFWHLPDIRHLPRANELQPKWRLNYFPP